MALKEVQIVKDNPPSRKKKKRNPTKGKAKAKPKGRKPAKRNPKGKGKAKAPGKRRNVPKQKTKAGYYWRKAYSRSNGKRVKGTWVKKPKKGRRSNPSKRKNPSRRAPAKRSSGGRRKNPRRVAAGRKAARSRKRNSGGGGRKKARRRNPDNNGNGAYAGDMSLKKTFSQVVLPELLGGASGMVASAMGPMWIEEKLGLDEGTLTEGYRDSVTSGVIALSGGMLIGKYIDKRAGHAFAIAGLAVTAVKLLRMVTMGEETQIGPSDGLGATLVRGALLGENDYSAVYGGSGAGQFSIQGV